MLRETIATGETIELALQKAREELGVDETDTEVKYEVLATPTKKTLGLFGGNPAKVRVYVEEVTEEENPAKKAAAYLKNILDGMGLSEVEVQINEEESGAALVLSGGDIGFIIGHRGETLDALQYLASLVANHADDRYYRITLDVGNYREKRKETLESLGKKMAMKSLKTGRNNYLEPMNPYERRIIHTAVQEVEGAKSWSEGEDVARHVVIGPVNGERYQRGRGQGNRRGYDRNNKNRAPGNRNHYNRPANAAAGTPKNDDPSAPIYGRIEKK